jgi:hypothetical protein
MLPEDHVFEDEMSCVEPAGDHRARFGERAIPRLETYAEHLIASWLPIVTFVTGHMNNRAYERTGGGIEGPLAFQLDCSHVWNQ